jgi:AraC-like DNA-binding protein
MARMTVASDVPADLAISSEWCAGGIGLTTLRGASRPTTWTAPVMTTGWALILARRGGYRRRADGLEHIVDANTGFLRGPGQDVSTATFATRHELTSLQIEAPFLDHLPDLTASRGPITVEPRVALAHRMLLRGLEESPEAMSIESAVLTLVQQCLRPSEPDRRIGGRIATAAARRRLVTDVLELLNRSLGESHGLLDIAGLVGASPYHLSRVFREVTGFTLSQYRTRLRVHAVLDRLEQGDDDLAVVAADIGFADHGHMTRTVIGHLGAAPSIVRQRLASGPDLSRPVEARSA